MRIPTLALVTLVSLPLAGQCAELPPRIVMMWQVTGRNYAQDLREIKSLGVNTVQSFALAGEDPSYVDGYFKAADEAGLGVVAFLGKFIEGEDANCACRRRALTSCGRTRGRRRYSHGTPWTSR